MKIAYCTWSILGSGGLERVLAIKANYLADVLGHDVTIITTFNGQGEPFHHFSPKIRMIDLGVEYKGGNIFSKLANRIAQRRILKKRLTETLDRLNLDICISLYQNEATLLPGIKDGSVKILENHSTRYYVILRSRTLSDKIVSRIRFRNGAGLAKKYDALVTLTEEDKRDWPQTGNIHVIPNPITIACDERARFEGRRVIAVGRITYDKGFDHLIKVWNIVERRHPDWELRIIGAHDDQAYVEYIRGMIRDFGLKKVVLQPPTQAIVEEYLKSDMLVMTSNFEGFGLVLTEGMLVGLPLVSFDCKCGPSEIITDGENGFLVKHGDIETFADRICRLIEDRDLHARMSDKALKFSKLYDIDNIMRRWNALFDKLMESKNRKG